MRYWFKSQLTALLLVAHMATASSVAARPPLGYLSEISPINSIVIKTSERRLIYTKSDGQVFIYSIAVGRDGRKWFGSTVISRKVLEPSWAPPPNIRKEHPDLPLVIPPGPNNPMGAAVLVLGDGTYGIHGTNKDETIGTDASYGCFRMHNADILALFGNVGVGTVVYVQP
jgi:lipoprotein-anchoring transpeptidase ErfK/SrfK